MGNSHLCLLARSRGHAARRARAGESLQDGRPDRKPRQEVLQAICPSCLLSPRHTVKHLFDLLQITFMFFFPLSLPCQSLLLFPLSLPCQSLLLLLSLPLLFRPMSLSKPLALLFPAPLVGKPFTLLSPSFLGEPFAFLLSSLQSESLAFLLSAFLGNPFALLLPAFLVLRRRHWIQRVALGLLLLVVRLTKRNFFLECGKASGSLWKAVRVYWALPPVHKFAVQTSDRRCICEVPPNHWGQWAAGMPTCSVRRA